MMAGSYVQIAQEFPFEEQVGNSSIVREPDRRRRLHHAVELPAAPGRREGRAGARRRLHRRAEAERGRAADRVHPRRDPRGDRAAEGRVQPGHRARARSWARRSSRAPTSTWCRSPDRPAPASGSWSSPSQSGEEGRARARRQVAVHHPGRRAGRGGGASRLPVRVPQRRPDLHRVDADARAGEPQGRDRRQGEGGRGDATRPATRWTRRRASAR